MELKIKKVEDKIKLDVEAQSCNNDCTYFKTYSKRAYDAAGKDSGCAKTTDARWTTWF